MNNKEMIKEVRQDLKENVRSIVVVGKRWNDSFGNTYHTVQIIVNGKTIHNSVITYGYGRHYEQTALDYLQSVGLVDKEIMTLWKVKEQGINYTSVVADVARRKDL